MNTHKLSFGSIILLKENMAEVIVNDGVVMDLKKVEEYHNFLLNNFKSPIGLLVNKKYSYTYTFEAQRTIAHLLELKAMAVFATTTGAVMSTETLVNINENINCNIAIFRDREKAIEWLVAELENN